MKVLFFSDVHGSVPATERVLHFADELAAEFLVLLGDVLYHGPRNPLPAGYDPARVAAMLGEHRERILAVRGNCDAEVDQMVLDFDVSPTVRAENFDGMVFLLTHGHVYGVEKPFPGAWSVVAQGHTHIPELTRREEGGIAFNPGSVSLPKHGSMPSFGFYESGALSLRTLEDGKIYQQIKVQEQGT